MIFNATPWGYKLIASLALAAFCGCSAEGGSSSGMGAGGGSNGGSTGGTGGTADNTGGTGGNVNDYQPVSVSNDSSANTYTLQMGRIKMVVNASAGARITEFSLDGKNVLSGPSADRSAGSNNYGSTFWTSPQSAWSWPPVAALDSQSYTGSTDAATNSIELVSGVATISNTTLTVTKRFVAVPDHGAIDVIYRINNTSTSASITVAPWQISRVAGIDGSFTFFGAGGAYTSTGGMTLADQDGIYWYSYAASTIDSKAKADGAGWIAHVTADNLLLLFQYPDIQASEAAPNEAEVELYTGPNGPYVEVEPQGSYATIAPGESREWTVRWKLRQIDSSTDVAVGSASLEAYAQQQRNQ